MSPSSPSGSKTVGVPAIQGAIEVWSSIVVALRQAGYEAAGPEYVRLSRLLAQQHTADLLAGRASPDPRWEELRRVAAEAVSLLGPVVEAASLLTALPTEMSVAPDAAPTGRKKPARAAKKPAAKKAKGKKKTRSAAKKKKSTTRPVNRSRKKK